MGIAVPIKLKGPPKNRALRTIPIIILVSYILRCICSNSINPTAVINNCETKNSFTRFLFNTPLIIPPTNAPVDQSKVINAA